MKIPIKIASTLAALGLLASTPVFAGSYTNNFDPSQPTDLTFGGNTVLTAYLTNQPQKCVVLNDNIAGEQTSITTPDFDSGQAIESFTATFQIELGPGTSPPADGVAFSFGPGVTAGSSYSETGSGGPQDLVIWFHTWNNGPSTVGGVVYPVNAPAVNISFGGNQIGLVPIPMAQMVDSQFHNVSIQLTRAGKVSVVYQGQIIYTNFLVAGWAPTAGLFNISGRCGGSSEWAEVAQLGITTVLQGAAAAPTIVTPPVSATVNEHGTTNFSVTVDGTAPFTFQWVDKGVDIPGETGPTLTMVNIPYTENGHQIQVRVSNSANVNGVTSAAALLTVIRDTTPPTVVKANASSDGTQVTVVFSKAVDMNNTAVDLSNYSIDQGVIISYPASSGANAVVLHLSAPLPGGLSYVLSIHGVQDTSSTPNTMAPTQVTFRSSLFQAGAVLHKKYTDPAPVNGTSFATLQTDPRYPNSPDRQDIMANFEYPAGGSGRDTVADPGGNGAGDGLQITYSDTLECFFTPPTTNDYVFFAAGADLDDVYLSTDTDPANMVNIAQVNGWTNARGWGVDQCGTSNGYRSDWYTGNMWVGAGDPNAGMAQIHLDGGQKYYMLAFHHRDTWSGGDEFAVTFDYYTNPPVNAPTNAPWGTAYPASGSAPVFTSSQVGAYLDPTGASVTFSQQPTDVTVLQGRTATFTALTTGQSLYGTNVIYQWQTAPSGSATFTNLPGATKNSYTTPATVLTDSGRQYQVLASVPGYTVPSSVVKLTVNADTIPPVLVSVAALPSQTGSTMDVGVTFDEPLDATSAGTLANYAISAGTITAVKYFAVSPGVVLTVSGLTAPTAYSVTVTGVADVNGNKITSANLAGTYSSMHWGVVGGDELQLGNGVVAVGPNAFDVYSDSIGAWGAYDEATFVYEQVTGPFDKEMRVEYVDPASQWARAGLIVRDVPNFGVNRAAQTGSGSTTPPWDGVASRYQKVHVQPVITAMGTAGADDYESNRRLDTGGQTDGPQTVGHTPAYPNAWVRLQRVGQTFTKFASDDGVNWINLGSTTWGVDDTNHIAMPDTLYVGPDYAPENGNVSPASLQAMFGIKVREYRNHGAVAPPTVTATENADGTFTLTYTGTLVSSDTAKGTYTAVSGASSPWKVNPKATGAKAMQFYRAQQ
jgi:hypothetical protein